MTSRLVRSGIRRLARMKWVRPVLRLHPGRPVILMYHGVSALHSFTGVRNASDLHMTREAFVSQLLLLRKYRRVIGISEMVAGLRDGEDMRKTVALTFDDGYANNALQAAPLLADHNMTAAFFLATSYIGTNRWIWTDMLENAFESTRRRDLPWIDGTCLPLGSTDEKLASLRCVKAHMKGLSVAERDRLLDALTERLGVAPEPATGDYQFMDWQQARTLADAGFEVGAHSMNHAILSHIPLDEARQEILGSRAAVEAGTGRCCPVFCYPNGKPADYNDDVVDVCRKHFIGALGTTVGHARRQELFQLARLSTSGDGGELAWKLLRES